MIQIDDYNEILEILLRNIGDEEVGHASFVSDADTITEMLRLVNSSTDAEPDLINFDNSENDYFVLELDFTREDAYLSYSIWPAQGEDEIFNTNYGLCLVDKIVPQSFEKDYAKYGANDPQYIKPIRVCFSFKDEKKKKADTKTSNSLEIKLDDNGNVSGFTKFWENDNSHFTCSFESTDEKTVLDVIKKLGLDLNA